MMTFGNLVALLLASLAYGRPVCEICNFTSHPSDEAECSVLGTLPEKEFAIRYYRVSEDCLKALNIDMAAVNRTKMWEMCPTPEDGDQDSLRRFLQTENTTVSNELRGMLPSFFEADDFGNYHMRELIASVQAQRLNCTLSITNCWNAVDVYLGTTPTERTRFCSTLHEMQANSLLLEQGEARSKMCDMDKEFYPEIAEVCDPLHSQIASLKPSISSCNSFKADVGIANTTDCGASSSIPTRVVNIFGAILPFTLAFLAF